jgi:hypothetical protein
MSEPEVRPRTLDDGFRLVKGILRAAVADPQLLAAADAGREQVTRYLDSRGQQNVTTPSDLSPVPSSGCVCGIVSDRARLVSRIEVEARAFRNADATRHFRLGRVLVLRR